MIASSEDEASRDVAVSRVGDEVQRAPAQPGVRSLFVLSPITVDRAWQRLVQEMLDRGHSVHVALEPGKKERRDEAVQLLETLRLEHPAFSYERLAPRQGLWLTPAAEIRHSLDYLAWLARDDADAVERRQDARARAPRLLRLLLILPPIRWAWGRRPIGWLLRRVEAAIPIHRSIRSLIKQHTPDVLVVSPLIEPGSGQGDYVRVAHGMRVPTIVITLSWDDLESRALTRDIPTTMIVASIAHRREAAEIQGVPLEQIVLDERMAEVVAFAPVQPAPSGASESGVSPQGASGLTVLRPLTAVQAVERTAATQIDKRREGRLLRLVLLLLTPLVPLVLLLLHPLRSIKAAGKAIRRFGKRMRRQRRARRHERGRKRRVKQRRRERVEIRR